MSRGLFLVYVDNNDDYSFHGFGQFDLLTSEYIGENINIYG